MRSRFAPDRALNLRMVATAFLLGLLFVTFTAVLIALIKSAVVAVVLAGALLFAQYWFSHRIALYAMNERVVTAQEPRSCTAWLTGCARWPTFPSLRSRSPIVMSRTRSPRAAPRAARSSARPQDPAPTGH